ncbi:hypothetical protein A6395_05060 [Exiguobacterium sp. SH31]|uniref:hypothetical protein n=1 Tax=Exiguobacterium sp. SH31 TaxID=1843183 RepID=UPI0008CF9F41|nr:hypothetical protein [Exiguobacterium sp. SH31]OGX79713.1 hypothetical protein A6395_05060 [Exiguobacterium sp. SH31]
MTTFHRLIIDGETYYREVNEAADTYHGELLEQEEVIEILLAEHVSQEIDVDGEKVRRYIESIPTPLYRQVARDYLDHLERMVESYN